jgi:hypothetical protein
MSTHIETQRKDTIADYVAEIARLETMVGPAEAAGSDPQKLLLQREMSGGALKPFLEEADGNPRLALVRAKAEVAAYRARTEMEATQRPGWLPYTLKKLVIPLILAILVPPLVSILTASQQLKLFREQKVVEAMRSQADSLLQQLSALALDARELRGTALYLETPADELEDQQGLSKGQAGLLYSKSVELERKFRLAMALIDLRAYPTLRENELASYYELRALQDCLQRALGHTVDSSWREQMADETRDQLTLSRLRSAAKVDPPCGQNFDDGAFSALTSAINQEASRQIGGSLFGEGSATK